MRDPHTDSPEPPEKAAARWAVRIADGLTPEQETLLGDWLAVDPRHARLLAEYRTVWERFEPLSAAAGRGPADAIHLAAGTRRAPILRFAFPALAAAAAAIAVGFLWRTAPAPTAGSALASLPPPCEQRRLADGSIIELNRGAELTVAFTSSERRVRISRGEVAFAVAKDPARPFVVAVGSVTVRAVGTAFNVRLGQSSVEVLVTEGNVAVAHDAKAQVGEHEPALANNRRRLDEASEVAASSGGQPVSAPQTLASGTLVGVGELMIVPLAPAATAPHVESLSADEIETRLAWQSRLLEFDDVPLVDIVAAFNRHNSVMLRIDDDDLAVQRMTASFRSSNIEGFVRLLEGNYGIRAILHTDGAIALRR